MHQSPSIAPAEPVSEPADQPDRTARYCANLDRWLAGLTTDAARKACLQKQLEAWEWRYSQFLIMAGLPGQVPAGGPHPVDYISTICEIGKRLYRTGCGND